MPRKNTPKGYISAITKKYDIDSRFILDSSYLCWNTTFIYTLERVQEAATRDVLQEKVFLEVLQNSQGKTCARASFLIKLQTLDLQLYQACNFIKKEALAQVFSCEFCEISKNTFLTEDL